MEINQGKRHGKAQEGGHGSFLKIEEERAERPDQEKSEKGHYQSSIRKENRIIGLGKFEHPEDKEDEG
jgi:hypothetical protein